MFVDTILHRFKVSLSLFPFVVPGTTTLNSLEIYLHNTLKKMGPLEFVLTLKKNLGFIHIDRKIVPQASTFLTFHPSNWKHLEICKVVSFLFFSKVDYNSSNVH